MLFKRGEICCCFAIPQLIENYKRKKKYNKIFSFFVLLGGWWKLKKSLWLWSVLMVLLSIVRWVSNACGIVIFYWYEMTIWWINPKIQTSSLHKASITLITVIPWFLLTFLFVIAFFPRCFLDAFILQFALFFSFF